MVKVIGGSVVVCAFLGVAACASGPRDETDRSSDEVGENVGSAVFELTSIPAGVGCTRIVVTGSSSVTKDFTLTAGASTASLNMDRLPIGFVSISGTAFATTCGTGSPLYIADDAFADLETGVTTTLQLTFRKNNQVMASANFVGNIQGMGASGASTFLVSDGLVYGWGDMHGGTPTQVAGLTGITAVAGHVDVSSACALKSDGSVWCWGDNTFGQAGVPSPTSISTPVRAGGGSETGFVALTTGGSHTCGVKSSPRQVKCWGNNSQGQLGNGTTTSTSTPTVLTITGAVASIEGGGQHTCLVDNFLYVRCNGENSYGQVGLAPSSPLLIPNQMSLSPVSTVYAGSYHSCAIMADRTVRCWGLNNYGQLGDNSTTSRSAPVTVSGLLGVQQLALGQYHSCARLGSGVVKCWGRSLEGQVGDGALGYRVVPTATSLPSAAEYLVTGDYHSCAVTEEHDVYCWGQNLYGQLGDGSYVNAVAPVKLRLP